MMSLPLRITYEGRDYTYTILTKVINKESTEIRILLEKEELTIAKNLKGEWDIQERTISDHPGLIRSIARAVALRYRLLTNWFSTEGDITFSSTSLYHALPALEYVQLLEDSVIYQMPIEALNKLYQTNIEIANWSRVIHQEALLKMQTLRLNRLSLSAKERYENFITENPGLIGRVNLGFITSYLGMTQQHLSSLRAEVRF
jgi:hypothetical protein